MQRRERVIGDLWFCRRDGRQKRGLASVGQTDEASVRDQLQTQPDRQLRPRQAGIGVGRRLVGRRLEVRVAKTTVATLGNQ